ncbi:MAG: 3-phosphoshikimate 1-carboxyvinyltransferase [Chitinophagaceae bacterium]|jgi:3-phosphoshikimate 1-carboxyvinyltransferase
MKVSLEFGGIAGRVLIPPSKSMSQRICAAALLHNGQTIISNYGKSDDEIASLNISQNLGASITFSEEKLIIKSDGLVHSSGTINCGESGLSARLFTPVAGLSEAVNTIEGSGSLRKRPMTFFKNVLEELNVKLPDFNGHIPFTIQGPLQPKNITVDGSLSSQFISGILLAFANSTKHTVQICVQNLVSKPYIDMTLEILEEFGCKIDCDDYKIFTVEPKPFSEKRAIEITVESDWSSAAFWIAAATISGSVTLSGLNEKSKQADKALLEIIKETGAVVRWENGDLIIQSAQLNALDADLTDAPDLFPVLAVLAASCKGKSKLKGLHRLVHKESNRGESIAGLLSQLEVVFEIVDDEIVITGRKKFPPIIYKCPNDHRMAMAAALAVMNSKGAIEIENAECVNKSYPDFWKDLEAFTQ